MGRTQARKRTRSTRISCVPSAVTDGTVHGPPCSATQLWHSHISVPVSDTFSENLAIATKAFHAQIEALSKKPPQLRQAGFSQLANKQRLEFRAGDTALGQLGLLQGLAITVRNLHSVLPWVNCKTVNPSATADCQPRWCKPLMTLPEEYLKA